MVCVLCILTHYISSIGIWETFIYMQGIGGETMWNIFGISMCHLDYLIVVGKILCSERESVGMVLFYLFFFPCTA